MELTAADVAELEQFVTRGMRLLERLRTLATPLPAGAEPPKERVRKPRVARARPERYPRPTTVPCEGFDCVTELAVGRRGRLPRFCRSCQRVRDLEAKRGSRPADPVEAEARARREDSRRRIEATLALADRPGAPLVKSQLLQRFDDRRRPSAGSRRE